MNLVNQIYLRKSCRKYVDEAIDMGPIHDFISNVKPLNEKIDYRYEILKKNELNIKTRWKAPYYLTLYSEKKENYLENIGFVFQQVSLFLQSIDIGSCWVGMASVKKKDPNFIIAIAFGKSNDKSREVNSFKRKKLSKISDNDDDRLEPARLAPSAINSQPWYFKHTGDGFDVYQIRQNIILLMWESHWLICMLLMKKHLILK